MNDEIRANYKKTHPVGTAITFVHMGFMKSVVSLDILKLFKNKTY